VIAVTPPYQIPQPSVHTFSGIDVDSSIGFGGGLVLPLTNVEAYAGVDVIDEIIVGVGVRYAIR